MDDIEKLIKERGEPEVTIDVKPITLLTGENTHERVKMMRMVFAAFVSVGVHVTYFPAIRSALAFTHLSDEYAEFDPFSEGKNSGLLLFAHDRLLKDALNLDKEELHVITVDIPMYALGILPVLKLISTADTLQSKLIMIEEPEIHLPPQLQIEMARFLVMMANKGAKLVISTNSDYIVHEISNCIKLYSLPEEERKEYLRQQKLTGYPDMAISPANVHAYTFSGYGKSSTAKQLTVNEYGVDAEDFEKVTEDLFNRSAELGEKINLIKQSQKQEQDQEQSPEI